MPATESGSGAGDFVLVPGGPKLALRGPTMETLELATCDGDDTTRPGCRASRAGRMSGFSILLPEVRVTWSEVPGRTGRPCLNEPTLMAVPQVRPCGQGIGLPGLGKPCRGVHPIHPVPPYQLTDPGDQGPKFPGNQTQPMPGMNSHPPK